MVTSRVCFACVDRRWLRPKNGLEPSPQQVFGRAGEQLVAVVNGRRVLKRAKSRPFKVPRLSKACQVLSAAKPR
ncbi:MAG: hypothetical protein AUK47_27410 [Deltaproteobacteria bacterium CG2_30_63_29]|nr:MAG: hypothetical protein AUK47_27410 [Deltaproteobacteria bacterium CG2_30_63_29]PJB46565.1 MAG: hypothetical protein CO108_05480 [Deltaproteobacteria bacterium CG_4_9_14_3_um_filter_63_12]